MAKVGHDRQKSRKARMAEARLGSRIHELRLEQGLSQEALAEKADLSPTYVSELERDRRDPSLSTLLLLADGLQVDLAELITREPKGAEDVEAVRAAVRLRVDGMGLTSPDPAC